jgi:hypothetical protein
MCRNYGFKFHQKTAKTPLEEVTKRNSQISNSTTRLIQLTQKAARLISGVGLNQNREGIKWAPQ